jgi:uncharacterized membrane protein YedE/YeeE
MLTPFIAPLLGGVVIGLASGGLYLLMGEIAGITGIARSAIGGPARGWQMAFVAGLLVAGLGAALVSGADFTAGIESIPLPVLVLAGLLVGVGTDLGNGCTSGHGVCGLSRLSLRSLAAVAVFMAAAGLTVFLVRHGGF